MTGTMNTESNQPMGMATTGTSEPMGDMNNGGAKPMGAMGDMNGGAKPMGAMGDMNGGAKPMGMASTGNTQMNGGGPEPHQGSNPGAQSDPGPKEVGFYDRADGHMGGDDGVQNTAERPSPMRMGGVDGSQPNPGQRGGQNTGTSGAQTTSQQQTSYSSEEEYGAGSIPGVTGTHEPGHTTSWHAATNAGSGAYQSRAAERLATANGGSKAMGVRMDEPAGDYDSAPSARMDEPAEDFKSTPAARVGDMAEDAVEKTQGFFAKAKDAVEDFFSADISDDRGFGEQTGSEGQVMGAKSGETYGGVSNDWGDTSYERDTPGTRPYNAGSTGTRSAVHNEVQQREKELTAA